MKSDDEWREDLRFTALEHTIQDRLDRCCHGGIVAFRNFHRRGNKPKKSG